MANPEGETIDRAAVETRLRSRAAAVSLACLVVAGLAWMACLVRLASGLDAWSILIFFLKGDIPAMTLEDDFKIAIIATVLLPAIGGAYVWRAHALWTRGTCASGTVTALGAPGTGRAVPATVVYKVRTIEYRTRARLDKGAAVGDVVPILYDPQRPRRVEVLDE